MVYAARRSRRGGELRVAPTHPAFPFVTEEDACCTLAWRADSDASRGGLLGAGLPCGGVVARLTALSELDETTMSAWHELAERAIEPNPFFEPGVALATARYEPGEVVALTVERRGVLQACLPLRKRRRRWHGVPVTVWSAWDPVGTPLVVPDDPEGALSDAVTLLAVRGSGSHLLLLEWLPVNGRVTEAVEVATRGRRPEWFVPVESTRPLMRRREGGEYLQATLGGGRASDLRRRRRRLEEALAAPLVLRDRGDDPGAVDSFLALEASGWKGRAGSALVCLPGRAEFFRDVCAAYSAQQRLRMLSLEAGATTVAMRCDLRSAGAAFGLRMTYDERVARYSPGVLLEIDAVRAFHDSRDEWMDSCTNHDNSPQCWLWPDERTFTSTLVAFGGIAGHVAMSDVVPVLGRIARRQRRNTRPKVSRPASGERACD